MFFTDPSLGSDVPGGTTVLDPGCSQILLYPALRAYAAPAFLAGSHNHNSLLQSPDLYPSARPADHAGPRPRLAPRHAHVRGDPDSRPGAVPGGATGVGQGGTLGRCDVSIDT